MTTPVITAAVRTAVGTAGGVFADVDVVSLAAPLIAAVGVTAVDEGRDVDEVIVSNCLGPGGDIARSIALAGGLDVATPGVSVDRQCGSGLEAIGQAATLIQTGEAGLVLAGGAESASTAPWRFFPPDRSHPEPRRYTQAPFAPDGFPDPSMGQAADTLAQRSGYSRALLDEYAATSHQRAFAAREAGVFDAEVVAVQGVSRDQRPRPGMTPERLARLRPSFAPDGTATAGNSCGISDGAALVSIAAPGRGISGLAVRGVARIGCDPAVPGLGAAYAIGEVLSRTGVSIRDVGAVEITEAFASVALATIDTAGLDPAIVCTDGGAIGLGHPWGASGALLVVRLFSRMVRADGPELGLAACAIGGGQGIAMLLERV